MKKSMKKVLAMLLMFAMVMSLAACGSGAGEAPAVESGTEGETADTAQPAGEFAETTEPSGDAITINFAYDEGVGDATRANHGG